MYVFNCVRPDIVPVRRLARDSTIKRPCNGCRNANNIYNDAESDNRNVKKCSQIHTYCKQKIESSDNTEPTVPVRKQRSRNIQEVCAYL